MEKTTLLGKKTFFVLAFLSISFLGYSQTLTDNIPGSKTFTVPCGVTSITVEAWGGGGGGQRANGNPSAGGGGSGGGYVKATIAVTPGNAYSYFVGAGDPDQWGGKNGTSTWFINNTTLNAVGGKGAGDVVLTDNTWGNGAIAFTTGNVGGVTVNSYGGNGANASSTYSGGGGSSGGSGSPSSNDAVGINGGAAPTDGYAGANGRNDGNPGNNGGIGAGGSGGRATTGKDEFGGLGGNGQIRITYTSPFPTYCSPTFTSNVEPITNVTFAGINNTTTNALGGPSLESFCAIGTVVQGTNHQISVKGNTSGNFTNHFRAFIDWNQDGDFLDAGESYYIGTINSSTGIDAKIVIGGISVPTSALLGNTRMRVMKRDNADPTNPCQTGSGYGQAEDYTINVTAPLDTYCTSYGNNTDGLNTGIRLVNFNTTIDNVTPIEDNDYSDFTAISTTVTKEQSYDLTVKVNTDGNWTNFTYAWIDWNQDGDFLDAGESYNLGTATNVSNGLTSISPLSITIPATAVVGSTRMRVSTKYFSAPVPCGAGFDGEVEDYTINIIGLKGPGGVTSNLQLWLRSDLLNGTITVADNTPVNTWNSQARGSNAVKPTNTGAPIYRNNAAYNINFNSVVDFTNDYTSVPLVYTDDDNTRQYLKGTSGFYSQDMFVVLIPDVRITSAVPGNDIFCGDRASGTQEPDATGIGYGAYTARFSNEVLTYAIGSTSGTPPTATGYGVANVSTTASYSTPGIINARNNTGITGQELYFNANNQVNTTNQPASFVNVSNSKYWIGRSEGWTGSLDGRIAEIITYSSRATAIQRSNVQSYLAIKYGITLGINGTSINYTNSDGNVIWNATANTGYNYDVAGIGRDDASLLNQKQSKSVNTGSLIAIGLGEVVVTNSLNISNNKSSFATDKDFLVWGNNNGAFSTVSQSPRSISLSGTTTTFTPVAKKWKIMESQNDVPEVIISIATSSLSSSIPLAANEKHVLVMSDNANFAATDIIDVVPLTINGLNSEVWYDFDGTIALGTPKYFTIAKATRKEEKRRLNIAAGEFILGDNRLALNAIAFSVTAWILNNGTGGSFISKGTDYNFKINTNKKVEIDWNGSTKITSINSIPDSKWHHIALTYSSGGTATLYIDGIFDSSVPSLANPTNTNPKFTIGALYTNKSTIASFNGDIDEVRIWNSALNLTEIRYIMNQEIEASGTKVNGEIIPKAITKNDIGFHDWNDLKAYYDMNSFYGTTVEDNSNNSYWARIKYLKKDKQIVEGQTAPLPYESAANGGTWDTPATWLNNAVQDLPNSASIVDGNPIDWNIVETAHNITSGAKNITVLGLISTAGKLTIDGTIDIITGTGTGQSLRVTHYLELDGSIDLEGESQLVQDEGSILDADSGGDLERDQQGTANSFNYNYWSSSVGPKALTGTSTRGTGLPSVNAPFTIGGVINDGRAATPPSIVFGTSPYAADGGSGAQLTISNYWLYQFYGKDDDYNSWFPRINENSSLAPGVGYTMKGSSGDVPITNQQNYVFKGKPYNGDFTLELYKSHISPAGDVDRLIGNPYPSALDSRLFILDNLSTANGGTNTEGNIFNGALYFWDHFGYANSHNLGAYVGGYATRNLTTGVKAQATDARINNDNSWGDKTPGQYVPVNQAFFVSTALDGFEDINTNEIPSVSGGDIVFKNSQRAFQKESLPIGNSVFMKTEKAKEATIQNKESSKEETKPIIKLMFDSPTGYHRQIAVGAVENTSNNFDLGYDAPIADIGKEDMFWIIQGVKFVIQGVPNFDDNQEFPIGLKIAKAGLARIKIDVLENMDEDISVHIKDKLTGETHNISQKAFEINLEPGIYLERFALTFRMQKLVAEDVSTEVLIPTATQPIIERIHVFMNNPMKELQIKNNSTDEILNIALINSLGQIVKTWNSNFNIRIISLPVNIATGVYLVQINTKMGSEVQKVVVE